jgi:phage terminase large subunit GpA-like protein
MYRDIHWRPRLNAIRAEALSLLRVPERMPLSRWIEANLSLPPGLAAAPGRIRLWKFQIGIADSMADPGIERVTVLKAARTGYSTLLAGVLAHFVRTDPTSILAVLPTESDVRSFITTQIEPVFEASPLLRKTLAVDRTAGSRDTLAFRRFPGGSLRVVSARAPRNLRAHTARVILTDEADAFEPTREGDAHLLAERRSMSFGNRKLIRGSTPTTSTGSFIAAEYERSDKRIFEVPCPSCGDFHEITWASIRWSEGRPEEAAWACPSCGVLHGEERKAGMVAGGRWRACAPHVKGHAGFRISALAAPHPAAAWPKLAAEFLDAKKTPDRLRTFVNTILGESWDTEDREGSLDPTGLAAMAAPISLAAIPAEVIFLCSGVDVQGDRVEVTSVGFAGDDAWCVLDHRIFVGDPLRDTVWHDLADFLREMYRREDGASIGRSMTAIDAGDGNMQDRVALFCRTHPVLAAIKGVPGARPLVTRSESKRVRLWLVGVDAAKARIHDRLTRQQAFRYSDALPLEWLLQLTSERRVVRYSRGQPITQWARLPGRMAEALDCCVYALAARALVGVPPARRQAELRGEALPAGLPSVVRSKWLDR